MTTIASTSSLKPPGLSPEARHQLRTRSPKGQRGRSRKSSKPEVHSPLRSLRASPWFLPGSVAVGACVVALLYSAIRISTHTADYYPPQSPVSPLRTAKKPRVGRPGAHDVPPLVTPSQSKTTLAAGETKRESGVNQVRLGEQELDEAIRSALENTWHLSKSGSGQNSPDAKRPSDNSGGAEGIDEKTVHDAGQGKPRTLAELYEELDGLGISVDELNEVMQNAVAGNL